MVCTTLGVATLGLEPPICAGRTLPVSLYLNAKHICHGAAFHFLCLNGKRKTGVRDSKNELHLLSKSNTELYFSDIWYNVSFEFERFCVQNII